MEELEWELHCLKADANGKLRYDLWAFNYVDDGKVASFDDFPTGEQIAAALAMWKANQHG